MMKRILFLCAFVFAVGLTCRADLELVYDNFDTPQNNSFYGPFNRVDEFGDDIYLGGVARTIEKVELECYASINTVSPSKYAIFRFYRQDGPIYEGETEAEVHLPGTLLFESKPLQVKSGYSILNIENIGLRMNDPSFFWTLQFYGLEEGDNAGMILYKTPTVGFSYGDFWIRSIDAETHLPKSDFLPYNFGISLSGNFGLRIYASSAPKVQFVGAEPVEGGVEVSVFGAVYQPIEIQSAAQPEGPWHVEKYAVLVGWTNTFLLHTDPSLYYQAVAVDNVPPTISYDDFLSGYQTNKCVLNVQGMPGSHFAIFRTTDTIQWKGVDTNYFIGPNLSRTFDLGENKAELYCFQELPLETPEIIKISRFADQESDVAYIRGPRGRLAGISYSADGVTWSKPVKERFSFFAADDSNYRSGLLTVLFPRHYTEESNFHFKIQLLD